MIYAEWWGGGEEDTPSNFGIERILLYFIFLRRTSERVCVCVCEHTVRMNGRHAAILSVLVYI